jgi:hypothetical protein
VGKAPIMTNPRINAISNFKYLISNLINPNLSAVRINQKSSLALKADGSEEIRNPL